MRIDGAELDRMLAEADRRRLQIRQATLEWQELGRRLLRDRHKSNDTESGGPNRGSARGR